MKDLKYLLLLIGFIIFAHATKNTSIEKTQARFLPDLPDVKEQKTDDSVRIQASNGPIVIPVVYN